MKKIKARELLTRRMLDKEFKDTKEVSKMEYEVYPNDKEVRVENLWFRDEYDNERKAFSFLTFEQILRLAEIVKQEEEKEVKNVVKKAFLLLLNDKKRMKAMAVALKKRFQKRTK